MPTAEPRHAPPDHRGRIRAGGGERVVLDIERRRIDRFRPHAAEVADEHIAGDPNEPRQRLVRDTPGRPGVERPHPGFLDEILGEAEIAANPARDIGVERPDRLAVGQDQVLFWEPPGHTLLTHQHGENPRFFNTCVVFS